MGRERVRSTRASRSRSTISFQVQPAPRMANLLAHLGGLAVPVLDLFEDFGGNAAGCAVLLQALHHLALGRKEGLEKLTDLVGGCLPLASRLQRLARFGNLIAAAQELLTARRRLLRRAE